MNKIILLHIDGSIDFQNNETLPTTIQGGGNKDTEFGLVHINGDTGVYDEKPIFDVTHLRNER